MKNVIFSMIFTVMAGCGPTTLGEASQDVGELVCQKYLDCGVVGNSNQKDDCVSEFIQEICRNQDCQVTVRNMDSFRKCESQLQNWTCNDAQNRNTPGICMGVLAQ